MKKNLLLVSALFLACLGTINAQTIIYSENFETTTGVAIPATWSQTTLATDGGWKSGTALSSSYFAIPAHTRYLATNDDGCNCDKSNDLLKTASFSCVGSTHPVASFDLFFGNGAYQGAQEVGTIEVSTNGGTTWTVLETLGSVTPWTNHTVDLTAYAGNATVMLGFRYNDAGGWLFGMAIDNFVVFTPAPIDALLQSVAPTGQAVWGAVSTTKTITGTVKNNGLSAITSFSATYNDGTVNATSNFTGLNIAYGATYNFTIATPYSIATASQYNLKVYINLASDANHANDTLKTNVNGYSFMPSHKVVMEEGTGTWCGWCVRGAVYMDSIASVYPTTVIPIAVHNGDPMVFAAYDTGIGALIGGYPTLLVDRKAFIGDPSDAFTEYANHLNDFGLADLAMTQTFNTGSRLLTVNASATMASSFTNNSTTNDYRLAVVVTENNVHGTATTYDQHNYYSGGGSGPMAGAGHDFAVEPDPVLAANMYYDFVARTILGGFTGQASSLPSSLVAGNVYNKTYTYTVPAAYNIANMKVNVLLIDAKNNIIYNGNDAALTTGINSIETTKQQFSLYPNPASSTLNMDMQLDKTENVSVSFVNTLGEVVMTKNIGSLQSGNNTLSFDINDLASGVYFVNVTTSKGVSMNKFVK